MTPEDARAIIEAAPDTHLARAARVFVAERAQYERDLADAAALRKEREALAEDARRYRKHAFNLVAACRRRDARNRETLALFAAEEESHLQTLGERDRLAAELTNALKALSDLQDEHLQLKARVHDVLHPRSLPSHPAALRLYERIKGHLTGT
jgi:hypothetical protein